MDKINEARKMLTKYEQNHVKVETEELANQILNIDFEQISELYEEILNPSLIKDIENIEPVKAMNPINIDKEEIDNYITLGEKTVKEGKFAVAIMAGGQRYKIRTYGT